MTAERIAFEPFGSLAGVLEGQPFRIFPVGTYHRGERKLEITPQRLQEFAANVKAGLPRFRIPINLEHDRTLGKYGTVEDVDYQDQGMDGPGLYATKYTLTEEGRKWLQAGKADAVSGEAIWTLNGNAKYQDPTTGKQYDNVLAGVALTATPFFGNEVNLFSADEMPKRNNGYTKLRKMMKDKFDELMAMVMDEDGMPAADDMPLLQQPPRKGADSMGDNDKPDTMAEGVTPEAFAAYQRDMEAKLTAATEKLAAETKAREDFAAQYATERKTRRLEQLQARAERFVALAAPDTFAEKMFELEQAAPDLATYFDGLLEQADKQIAVGELFSQKGSTRQGASGETLTDLAGKLHAEKFGGDPDKYSDALALAGKQRPDLMRAYLRGAPGKDEED